MKTAVEQALESLQQKRKHFIGNHKDSNSITETKGFLQGLDWAIDTIETEIENERCEEEWRQVPTAEEVIEKMVKFASVNDTINCTVYSLSKVMIEFAKLHVEAALKGASIHNDLFEQDKDIELKNLLSAQSEAYLRGYNDGQKYNN